jgi:hypothetical protein
MTPRGSLVFAKTRRPTKIPPNTVYPLFPQGIRRYPTTPYMLKNPWRTKISARALSPTPLSVNLGCRMQLCVERKVVCCPPRISRTLGAEPAIWQDLAAAIPKF